MSNHKCDPNTQHALGVMQLVMLIKIAAAPGQLSNSTVSKLLDIAEEQGCIVLKSLERRKLVESVTLRDPRLRKVYTVTGKGTNTLKKYAKLLQELPNHG